MREPDVISPNFSVREGPTSAIPKSSVFAEGPFAPSVIDDNRLFHGTVVVKPAEEHGGIPVPIRRFPVTVAPNDFWFVRGDDLLKFRHSLLHHKVVCSKSPLFVLSMREFHRIIADDSTNNESETFINAHR